MREFFDEQKVRKTFIAKLKELRWRKGWSGRDLADKLGLAHITVHAWEMGQFIPDVLTLADIADLFMCSMNELIGGEQPYNLAEVKLRLFGEIIKEKRKARGWSQMALGEQVQTCGATIGCWETGKTYPSLVDAAKLANVFACSVDELVGRRWPR